MVLKEGRGEGGSQHSLPFCSSRLGLGVEVQLWPGFDPTADGQGCRHQKCEPDKSTAQAFVSLPVQSGTVYPNYNIVPLYTTQYTYKLHVPF